MPFLKFLHLLGMGMWIGGMVSAMVIVSRARAQTGLARSVSFDVAGRLYSLVIGPGALVTVVTGLVLTMSLAQRMGGQVMALPRIWVMQASGLIAGLLVLFVALPTATRLARLTASEADGDLPAAFGPMQRRMSIVVHVVALLFLVALYFVVAVR